MIIKLVIEYKKFGLKGFLVVSKVPELYRKLREACRNNFPQVSSKFEETSPYTGAI